MAERKPATRNVVCVHRRARFDYEIVDTVEMGLVLAGSEVKALREGKGNLTDAYVMFRAGRPVIHNFEISPYSHDRSSTLETRRTRKLLLNASEIRRIQAKTAEKGLSLIPLSIYFKGPWAKVEVGLGRGKRHRDKRQDLRKREAQRDIDREARRRR
ncbi:MAG: SsrA-binding protein SmpB [Planctomycetota bacterium]|jgi:SsrA-binding protein